MNFIEELQAFSQDPTDIGHRSTVFRFSLVALLFLVIAGAATYYEWDNKTPDLEAAKQKQETLMAQFRVKHKKAVNLEAYKKQLADMRTTFDSMLNQLPGKTELDNLVVDISTVGTSAGLDQKQFQKQNEIMRDFYAELPITITLEGSYHQLADFVSRVAALPRIVTLHNFDIKKAPAARGSAGRSRDNAEKLQMKIIAKTYRYLEDGEGS
ncbi:MAG: type 4a pilus biogenesis protein PilO [Gammaproteobacteria bacterium]|nr:type 4a pilus biogenesis protein PilO [Gammaproteobacteria bacterium]NNC97935.1 type 4a pilus biogenesis protein PilO [Gammaproteobacteria bacterium]NNM14267.1 type 4a pilus biogenesis protein PilO [Gammaproteobacteria bacterium]